MKVYGMSNGVWLLTILLSVVAIVISGDLAGQGDYQKDSLIFQDNFDTDLSDWVVENKLSDESKVEIRDGQLLIDVNSGATIWCKQKLFGNLLIEFNRKVVMGDGANDRLSDFNFFWMATDPRNESLFNRDGTFAQYDSLSLYYVGIGGNYNSTTRFRKYMGTGERFLLQEKNDEKHLLQPNQSYFVQVVICNGTTKVFVNGEEYFTYDDPDPLTEGYFGFRTVKSRQEIEDIHIYSIRL